MALPIPYDALLGAVNDPAEHEALNLRTQYAWLYRLARDMNDEIELDLKRAAQLALHTRKFRLWYDKLVVRMANETIAADPDYPVVRAQGEIRAVIEGAFALRRTRWATRAAMVQELQAFHAEAGTLYDWMEANAAAYKQGFSTNRVVSADGDMTDVPIKITKPPEFATRIAAFLALFAAA